MIKRRINNILKTNIKEFVCMFMFNYRGIL